MSIIKVNSEIGPLKKVLLHRPGDENLNLTPDTLERLLFDDIPYLTLAQKEHDYFANALRAEGVEVIYLVDLVVSVLEQSADIRTAFLRQFIDEGGVRSNTVKSALFEFLDSISDTRQLVHKTIAGVEERELGLDKNNHDFFLTKQQSTLLLDPMPNLYASRDPFASIGSGGASIHRMKNTVRARETIFAETIFKHHPDFKDTRLYYNRDDNYSIEGGDVQVLCNNILGIGISERTEPRAITRLAQRVFNDANNTIDTVLAFDIPSFRSFMHLDTVMTRVDVDKFAVHDEIMSDARVFEIKAGSNHHDPKITEVSLPLEKVLEKYLGIDQVTLLKAGNGERIAGQREQWSDGVNTLCVRPGTIIVYDRNFVTNQVFREAGLNVIEIPCSELIRGRSGPHCMSMALEREW